MNISRRGFLKLMGASIAVGVAESAVPGITKAIEPKKKAIEPKKKETAKIVYVLPGLEAGRYAFSYYFKSKGSDNWCRIVNHLVLEEGMDLRCEAEIGEGESIWGVQVELYSVDVQPYISCASTNHYVEESRFVGVRRVENLYKEPYVKLEPGQGTFQMGDTPYGGRAMVFSYPEK